jgi:uncharacterized protein
MSIMSKHFVIDGYNVLHALPELPPGSWEEKRRALLWALSRRKPHGRNRLTVVFDSQQGLGDKSEEGGIAVLFPPAQSADEWIARFVRETDNPRNVVVVTDDLGIRQMIRGTGARWMPTADFWSLETPRPIPEPQKGKPERDAITEEFKKKWLGS